MQLPTVQPSDVPAEWKGAGDECKPAVRPSDVPTEWKGAGDECKPAVRPSNASADWERSKGILVASLQLLA